MHRHFAALFTLFTPQGLTVKKICRKVPHMIRNSIFTLLVLTANACLLPAPEYSKTPAASSRPVLLVSDNPALLDFFCREMADHTDMDIRCAKRTGVICAGTVCRGPFFHILKIEALITRSSGDMQRNILYSLASFGTLALVTKNRHLAIRFDLSQENTAIARFALHTDARTGYYALLPFWAGLIGTAVGTSVYQSDTDIQESCDKEISENTGARGRFSELSGPGCSALRILLADGFSHIREEFYRNLAEHTAN